MRGGGTKPEKYCKLTTYVQHNAPLFYECIQNLCLFGIFNPRKGNGVTLLLPSAAVQKKIDKLVGKDASAAYSAIMACVLSRHVADLQGFDKEVVNKLGHVLPVKKVTASSVELSNGAKITRDSKFKRLHGEAPIAVYNIDKEVPEGKAPAKKGGNDDFKERGYARPSEHNWLYVAQDVRDAAVRETERRTGRIDVLTHNGLSFLNFLKGHEEYGDLADLLIEVHPMSPLYFLFIGGLVPDRVRKEWCETINKYDKLQTLKAMLGVGCDQSSVDAYKRSNVKTVSGPTICAKLHEFALGLIQSQLQAHSGAIEKHFGSSEKFAEWMVMMSEFVYLYTVPYVKALDSGDKTSVGMAIDTIIAQTQKHIRSPASQSDFKKCLMLANAELSEVELFSKERFCTLLSLYVSNAFFPCASSIDALMSIEDGTEHAGTLYGHSLRPDRLTPTSFNNIVARYWAKTVQ